MKRNAAVILIAIASLGANDALASPAPHDSAHAHHASASPRPTFDDGRKWATDEPLRRHMEAVRELLARHSSAVLQGELTWDQAKVLGADVELKVAAILADCRLAPGADANLHLILADMVEGADILQGKTRHRPEAGTAKVARATQMYATYFEHPGWRPAYR